ncbi:hypothetical protein [Paenibacillus lactis]|uniref:hypothetical protein n=1 Tax=Paenibacillus lactis TaxID=228574 RepID=UPI003D762CD7
MIKGFVEIPLLNMINQLGEEETKVIISDFSCPQGKDVEYFLKYRAIEFAKQSITQTQLVFMQHKDETRLVGYYSLTSKFIMIKDSGISTTLRKRISKFGTRDTSNKGYMLTAPLIAQLGKNFTDGLNKLVTGDELLQMAINKVKAAQVILGGKVVYLECEDSPKLLDFYNRNGFRVFGQRERGSEDEDRIEGEYLLQLLRII